MEDAQFLATFMDAAAPSEIIGRCKHTGYPVTFAGMDSRAGDLPFSRTLSAKAGAVVSPDTQRKCEA